MDNYFVRIYAPGRLLFSLGFNRLEDALNCYEWHKDTKQLRGAYLYGLTNTSGQVIRAHSV